MARLLGRGENRLDVPARGTFAALVPGSPASVPPAGIMFTVPPLIWAASSAAPSARAVLCETRTIPTVASELMAYPESCSALLKGRHDPSGGARGADSGRSRFRRPPSRCHRDRGTDRAGQAHGAWAAAHAGEARPGRPGS